MPTPKTSTTSDSVVNDYVAVASISARKKNSSRTMTPTPPLVIPPVIKRGVGVFAIWFVGYLVYTNQSVNYFLFCGWVNHVFVLPIVSLRDGSHQLATVEYNLQTRAISGMIAYAVALWIVLYGQEISQYTTLLGVDSAIALKSKEYLALGVIAGFDCYQANFWKSYCYPSSAFDSPKYSYLYIFGGRLPDELFLFPLEMFVMVCVVPNNKSLLENEYTTFIIAFIIYRLLQFGLEYRSASSATTKTVPINHLTSSPTRIINHFEQQQTPNNGCTSSTSNANKNDIPNNNICSMTKKNVWRIYGNRYDVTDFVNKHPGGIETIMLAANREDSTALFQSYHAFNIRKAKAILEKYRISNDTIVPTSVALMVKTDQKSIVLTTSNEDERSLDGETVSISDTDSDTSSATATDSKETPVGISSRHVLTSNHHDNDLFYDIISQRVAETLRLHNIDPIQDRGGTYGRYLFYILLFLGNIFALTLHCKGSVLGSIVFAIVSTFLGGHVGHDGGHFAVSRIPIVNDVAVWFISGVSNPMTWQHQHTYAHHSHTNVCDHDPDLHHFNQLMRLSRREPLSALRKKQAYAVYVFFAFTVTCFATCFRFPWRFVIERSMHGVVGWSDRQRFIRTFGLFFHLITYTALVGIIPFFVHKSAWSAFLSVLAHVITCGFLFACVSQVGHLTENKLNRDIDKQRLKRGGVAVNSWAANQIEATNDFCPQSTLSFYLFGGLGLQIEHHLFPSLNHCHLQLIQPVVEKTCQEFNVEYTSYDSWMDVMKDTLTLFRNLAYDLE